MARKGPSGPGGCRMVLMAEPEAEDPSTVCSGLSYESRSLAQSTFSFPGETDLDVSM